MNYQKLRFPKFKPYLKEINSDKCSCGGSLVNVITSVPLKLINHLHPCNEDWTTEWVETFLFLCGYKLIQVPDNFVDKRKGFKKIFYHDHLLVHLLDIDKNEWTWCCSYKHEIFHGQHLFKDMNMGEVFLNAPIRKTWICVPIKKCK